MLDSIESYSERYHRVGYDTSHLLTKQVSALSDTSLSELPDNFRLSEEEIDQIWTNIGSTVLQRLNLNGYVPVPTIGSSQGVRVAPGTQGLQEPAPIRLSSVFCKIGSQVHLPGAVSRYYCLGPLYAILDMARCDLVRLNQSLRRLHSSSRVNTSHICLRQVTKQYEVKVAVTLADRVSLFSPDDVSDAFVDFSAAPELRSTDRMYIVTEVVQAETLKLEVPFPTATVDNQRSVPEQQHHTCTFRNIPIAFAYKKYRLVQSTGQICRQMNTPVSSSRGQFLYRSSRGRDRRIAAQRSAVRDPTVSNCSSNDQIEHDPRHQEQSPSGNSEEKLIVLPNRRFNRSLLMRYPRPISSYVMEGVCLSTEASSGTSAFKIADTRANNKRHDAIESGSFFKRKSP